MEACARRTGLPWQAIRSRTQTTAARRGAVRLRIFVKEQAAQLEGRIRRMWSPGPHIELEAEEWTSIRHPEILAAPRPTSIRLKEDLGAKEDNTTGL